MNNNFELDDTLEIFMEYLAKQKNAVKIVDFRKYDLMLETAFILKNLLSEANTHGEINVGVNQMFNLGSVTTEIKDLTIYNIEAFTKMVEKADNFEIYPLTNGNIRLSITFQSVLKRIR